MMDGGGKQAPDLLNKSSLLLPSSTAYTVSRNLSAHASLSDGGILPRIGVLPQTHQRLLHIKRAQTETLMYIDRIAEYGIPNELLNMSVLDNLQRDVPSDHLKGCSTLTTLRHCGETFVAHSSGEKLDEVTVRSGVFLQSAHAGYEFEPGFTISVGNGARLREVHTVGTGNSGASSNLLVSTSAELFFLQTTNGPDYSFESGKPNGSSKDSYDATRRREWYAPDLHKLGRLSTVDAIREHHAQSLASCPILEARGKWQLPQEIIQVAPSAIASPSSTASAVSQAWVLTRHGGIYSWTPSYGVRLEMECIADHAPLQHLHTSDEYDPVFRRDTTFLAAMPHNKLAHVVHRNMVATFDSRCHRLSPRKVFDAAHECVNQISALQHHGRQVHEYFVSTDRAMFLMDMRYERTPLHRQLTIQPSSHLQYHHVEDHRTRSAFDCLLGRNSWVEDAWSHQRRVPDLELHVVQRLYDAPPSNTPTRTLLHAFASPLPSSHHIARWQTEAATVVDRDVACVGATMLWSSALPRLSKALAEEVAASLSDDVTASSMLHDWLATRNNAVCLHQNALGDLYAQQWWWDANGDAAAAATTSGSAMATTDAPPSTAHKSKRPRPSLAQPGTASQDEQPPTSTSAATSASAALSSRAQKWSAVAAQRRSLVQWHGAVGTRGRSVRAMHFLYQALLKSRRVTPFDETLAQLARWNPVLCRQLLAVHRYLAPSSAQTGPTVMHAKLHPALRLPISLPPPRDNAAYRFAAPVAYYRTTQREDARQGQDVFLLDLRGLHLHRAPPRAPPPRGQRPPPRTERNDMQRRLQRWKQRTTAIAVTAAVRLSLYELWAQLVAPTTDTPPPPPPPLPPSTAATADQLASPAELSLPALYDLLRVGVEAGELQLTWETVRYAMSTAEVYARFSDGLYVTGTRVSRRDRIAAHATRQRQAAKAAAAAGVAAKREEADGDTQRGGRKRPRRRRDDAPTEASPLPSQPMCDCYWRRVSRWPTETSIAATPASLADVWCGRRDCVTPHHLVVVLPQSFFIAADPAASASDGAAHNDTDDDEDDDHDDANNNDGGGGGGGGAAMANASATPAAATSAGGFDLRSLIFSSSQTPAAPPTASSSTAMPSLKSLIHANAAPTAGATAAGAATPAPPSALVSATQRSMKPSQTVTFAPLTPFSVQSTSFAPSTQASTAAPATPLSMPWQQSDVTDDVVEDLLGRWDTQQRGATNSLRQRLTPKLAASSSRSSQRDQHRDDLRRHRHDNDDDDDGNGDDGGDGDGHRDAAGANEDRDHDGDGHIVVIDADADADDDDENAEEALRRQAQFSRSYFSLMLDDDDDDDA